MSANSSRVRRRSNSWSSVKQPAAQLSLPADDDVAGGNAGNLLEMPRICRCCCKRDLELLNLFGADKPTISSTVMGMETDTDTSTMRRRSTTTSTPLGDRTNGNPVDYALSGAHSSMDIVLEEMIIWMLNVSRDDGLPQEICRQCMAQFLMVAKFRRKCVRMQQRLQDYAQEISDRQAARQAKRKQRQQQRQELQNRPQADKEAKDTDAIKDANASDYMHLPESQMDRKRRIISESEGEAPSPLPSLPKIVKTEESVTEEVLPLPEGRRLQQRLRRMRTKSAGTTASAETAEEEPPVRSDRSSMPWKTKAARKQLSESWSSYSPAPSSEVDGQWSNSSEAATENLSDLSVDPLCGFESDSNPSSTSAPSELKFPRRAPKAVPAQRRGRRPRSSPVYMAAKRQRRSVSKKPTMKELLQQIGASVEENTKSDEKICCQNPKEEQYENDSLCPAAKSSFSDEESDISTSDAGESTVGIEEVKETNGKEEAAKELPSRTEELPSDSSDDSNEEASPSKLSMGEEQKLNGATTFDVSSMELQSKELTSSTEATDTTTSATCEGEQLSLEGEEEPDQTEIIVSIPLEALNDDLQRRLCVENDEQEQEEDQQKKQQLPGNPDDVNNNANDENFCQSATADSFNSAVALQTTEIEAKATGPPDGCTAAEPLIRVAESPPTPPDGDEADTDTSASTDEIQVVRTGPTPMDFLAEFEKHCEKGLEQLGATTPASSPPATPRAEPLPLALNDLEAKQQLEVEMNDVETTLNGILNEMQDQHIYTPTCPHIDEFLTPADYASLSEPEQEQELEPTGDIKPESQEKPNPNLFDNSNFSNELIGFQNDIPCFENIETTPEPEQSLHLELTQFLNELQPQPQQAVQTVQGPQVEVIPTEVKPVVEQSPVQIQVQVQQQPLEHLQVRQPIVSKALEQVPQVHHQETTTTVSYEQIYHHHQQHSVQQQQQSASKLQLAASIDPQQQQQQWQQYQPQEQQQQTTHLQWSAVGGLEAIKSGIGPLDGTTTTYYISAGDLYQHQQQGAPLETTYTMLDPNENYILEQANHHQQQQQQQHQQQQQQQLQQQQQQPIMILIQQPEPQQPVASSSNPQQAPMHFYGAPISNELHHLQQQQQQQQQHQQQQQVQNHSVLGMQRVAPAAAAASAMPATTPKGRAVSLKCRFCQNGPRFSNSLEYSRHIIELHPAVAPFNCPHCPLAFAARSKRSQHILNHHVVQQYQCGQCSQVFPAQRALDLHIQRFHMQVTSNTGGSEKGGAGGVRVEEVQLQISNEQQQQQQSHPPAKPPGPRRQRILCCPDCEDCTSGHSHGNGQYEELQTNLQAPPTVLTPPSTIMSVPSPQPMMSTHQHITLPSPEQSEPDSTTTLRQFRKRGVIVSPQSGIFNQTLQLATPVASPSPSPSSSPSSSTLDTAPNTPASASASVQVSELRASHQCLYCEERFTNDIALRKHHQLAHGAQTSMPFVCTICKRGYRMRTALHRHMESHDVEGRPYECNLCHVRFPRPSQLTLHKITVHLLSKPHTCDECGKQFGTESALKTHVKFHGELAYQCDECDLSFEYIRDLRKHRRTHKGELFYKCEFCPRSFLHFMGFRAHMNSHLPLGVFLNEETQLKSSSNCSTTSNSGIHNDKSGENPATPSMEETALTPMSNINSNPDECCLISNSVESSVLVGRSLPSLDSIAATP
ncbi:uncharacterized protein DMAD_08604 [Drosophila madeirensis]|uniref:C2H2-type domain-containing protein n=1 Tax=Drosophila madeirensis TaxID=30013 RepID=A0AAU9EW77_DROMD